MKNKIKLAAKILAILIICLVSFVGVYVQKGNKVENQLKSFTLSKDLKGYREITFEVHNHEESEDTEKSEEAEKEENKSENLTTENYEKSKSIIQKRLEDLGVKDYNIALDKQTGLIYIQIPENDLTDKVVSNITQTGSVEIKDSEDTNNVLVSSDKLKKASAMYSTAESGTTVFLQLEFDKEGTEKLQNISENEYKTDNTISEDTTADTTEEENTEKSNDKNTESSKDEKEESKEKTQKKVALYMSGEQITTTSFDEPIKDGIMRLTLGQASTESKTIEENLQSASTIAAILNNGILPIQYEVNENQYVQTDISAETIRNVMIAVAIVIGLLIIYMIIKYKAKGLLAAIGYVGFIALYLLLLRYTNVVISLEGIVAGVIASIINYIFVMKLLSIKIEDNKKYNKEYIKLLIKLIPILAISIVFCFVNVTVLESFGMVMFWGIILVALYNILVTKHLID